MLKAQRTFPRGRNVTEHWPYYGKKVMKKHASAGLFTFALKFLGNPDFVGITDGLDC